VIKSVTSWYDDTVDDRKDGWINDTADDENRYATMGGESYAYDAPGLNNTNTGIFASNFIASFENKQFQCSINFHVGLKIVNGEVVDTEFGEGFIDLDDWMFPKAK
jgi:hypothetical protein